MINSDKIKFDVIVGNPPYKGDLHLKFLEKAEELTKDDGAICFVHPGAWILDEKPTNKRHVHKNCLNLLSNYKTDLEFINGNKEFNAKFFVPCVITTIDKAKSPEGVEVYNRITDTTHKYSSVKEINIRGNKKEYFSLKKKLLEFPNNLNELVNLDVGEFCIEISLIRGNVDQETMTKDDFYTFVPRQYEVRLLKDCDKRIRFAFEKKLEATNFLNYLKTDFARFALSVYKINGHMSSGELSAVPYMDFTEEWTDEKLFKHFKLSIEEVKLIKDSIPAYYE